MNTINILKQLLKSVPEIKAVSLVSIEGLPITSILQKGFSEKKIAVMTATLLALAERAALEMGKGAIEELYVKGSEGYIIILQAGPDAVLTVSTTANVQLGLIFMICKRTCEKISKLGNFEEYHNLARL